MSLTSLLLGSNAKIDKDLDKLFDIQPPAVRTTTSLSTKEVSKKRKLVPSDKDAAANTISPKKRARRDAQKKLPSEANGTLSTDRKTTPRKNKQKEIDHETENDSDSDNSDLENTYASKSTAPSKAITQTDDEDDAIPVHETLARTSKQRVKRIKRSHPAEDETPEMRDRRTIFVGNLSLEILSKKPLKKQLQRHILSFVPTAKIESTRFRSIPFQAPTTKLPDSDETSKMESRTHTKDRASNWRAKQDDKGEESVKADEKKYLTPAQKKKIAYINQEFHTTADVVNSYIVFALPQDAAERPANLPPLPPTMDPYQAALQAAVKADGSLFMDRVLRVDLVGKAKRRTNVGKSAEDEVVSIQEADPHLSIFVGNLDFASKEEDLRAFFESLMRTERGAAPGQSVDEDTSNPTRKPPTWVTRVRIVRDNATQLGKGFAYVEFMDKQSVDEILAMEESKLKFAKRKLRVQRCKKVPGSGGGTGVKHTAPQEKRSGKTFSLPEKPGRSVRSPKQTVVVVPRGDPSLGEKLVGLSKEERKQRKSEDLDRVARRLAKKKKRMAMVPNVGKDLRQKRNRVRSKAKKA